MKNLMFLLASIVLFFSLTGCGAGGFIVVRSTPQPPPASVYYAPAYYGQVQNSNVGSPVVVRGESFHWDGYRYVVQTHRQRVDAARARGYMRGYCARSTDPQRVDAARARGYMRVYRARSTDPRCVGYRR